VYYLASSVAVVGVEDRPPFGDLGCALRHRLRSSPERICFAASEVLVKLFFGSAIVMAFF